MLKFVLVIATVLIANIMFAVKVLTFTHLRKKNLEKFEYRNTEFYFDFRFSIFAPWRFCAQICHIANVLIANIMLAVKVLTFTHLRKKNLENFEHRNTEFYFDFRFSIFAHLAFLCSNLYYRERTHCEYHVRSEGSHFHPSSKEKQQNLNIEIQDFISIFFFRHSATWRFCAQFCTTACVLIANIIFAVKMLNLNIVAEATCLSRSPGNFKTFDALMSICFEVHR